MPCCKGRVYKLVVANILCGSGARTTALMPRTPCVSPSASPGASPAPGAALLPSLPAELRPAQPDVLLSVHKSKACARHQLLACPACHPDEYMRRRVVKAVACALKRLGQRKTHPFLTYLGADSWAQVLEHLQAKREAWNEAHPQAQMSITNTALDHIRPVSQFQRDGHGAQSLLCNHYTNLQPLLHEDNIWKADCWSFEDEKEWHSRILFNQCHTAVYYPRKAPWQPSLLASGL